jgi:hypothetical protein
MKIKHKISLWVLVTAALMYVTMSVLIVIVPILAVVAITLIQLSNRNHDFLNNQTEDNAKDASIVNASNQEPRDSTRGDLYRRKASSRTEDNPAD